jgi:polar amino acid transport system substrate-binding protein
VVISKRHWRGTSHLYRFNAGLKALKKEGRFEEIVARHLEQFWGQLQ